MVYADTSVLASYYLHDANGASAIGLISELHQPLAFNWIHRLELRNALALAIFRGELTRDEGMKVWGLVAQDRRNKLLLRNVLSWERTFREAYLLCTSQSETLGTRSLDILHVAAARQLRTTVFLSFDKRQRALAQSAGFQVVP